MRTTNLRVLAGAVLVCSLAGCGGDDSGTNSSTVTVLDVTVNLLQGEGCDVGGKSAEFTGQTGNTVTVVATTTTSAITPVFVLYAPDYATQLGTSHPDGVNKSKLTVKLTAAGLQHLTICDPAGVAGPVKVVVTRPLAG